MLKIQRLEIVKLFIRMILIHWLTSNRILMGAINNQLKGHFLNLYSVALSDSEVETRELQLLYKFGESYGIDKDEIDEIIENPHRVRISIPDNVYEKVNYLYDLAKMILADEKIDLRETKDIS